MSGLNQRFAKPSYWVNWYREFKSLPLRKGILEYGMPLSLWGGNPVPLKIVSGTGSAFPCTTYPRPLRIQKEIGKEESGRSIPSRTARRDPHFHIRLIFTRFARLISRVEMGLAPRVSRRDPLGTNLSLPRRNNVGTANAAFLMIYTLSKRGALYFS